MQFPYTQSALYKTAYASYVVPGYAKMTRVTAGATISATPAIIGRMRAIFASWIAR